MIATGTTYRHAVDFVLKRFKGCHLRFIPLVYRDRKVYAGIRDKILWRHRAFQLGDEEIDDLHFTNYAEFPYAKAIRTGVMQY